jgi:hypothetical protein
MADLPHVVTVAPFTGVDEYGTPTYGPAVSYPARVQYTSHEILSNSGQWVHQAGIAYVAGSVIPGVAPRDKITLPDGSTPPILRADMLTGPDGVPHHCKVSFG